MLAAGAAIYVLGADRWFDSYLASLSGLF
jgi:hypothetical protein